MPTYVYRFIDTGETIEVRQSFDDAPLTEAPHPSDGTMRPVKKVFTPVGITFKGSGFYKTDAASGGTSSGSASSGSDTSSGSTSSGTSSGASSESAASTSSSSAASTSSSSAASTSSSTGVTSA